MGFAAGEGFGGAVELEVAEADLLLHVVDITHPQATRQAEAVRKTLEEIGAAGKPAVSVLNKIDRLPTSDAILPLMASFPNSVAISALTGEGLKTLLAHIEGFFEAQMVWLDVLIPYELGELVDLFHRRGLIEQEEHTRTGTHITGRIPRELVGRFDPLQAATQDN